MLSIYKGKNFVSAVVSVARVTNNKKAYVITMNEFIISLLAYFLRSLVQIVFHASSCLPPLFQSLPDLVASLFLPTHSRPLFFLLHNIYRY